MAKVRKAPKADVASWLEEARSRPNQDQDITNLSIEQLFRTEPSWRGSRRKNLIAQGMAAAAKEELARKGTGNQELWEAARLGNFERMMDLLFRSKDYSPSDKDLSHGIHAAAAHGRDDIIELLIRHGADPGDNCLAQGFTPLMLAASKGHLHAALLLIDRGASANAINDMGQTALHLAAINGHGHVVKALVAEGAEAWHRDKYGRTPADCTRVATEEHDKCRRVLESAPPKPKPKVKQSVLQDVDGTTPCHHELVNSMHGLPSTAHSGLQLAANLA